MDPAALTDYQSRVLDLLASGVALVAVAAVLIAVIAGVALVRGVW